MPVMDFSTSAWFPAEGRGPCSPVRYENFLLRLAMFYLLRLIFIQSFLFIGELSTKTKEPLLPLCCKPNGGGLGAADTRQRYHPRLWWAGNHIPVVG